MKKSLPKSCLRGLLHEAISNHSMDHGPGHVVPRKAPFEFLDPFVVKDSSTWKPEYEIERWLPVRLTTEEAMELSLDPDDMDEVAANGVYDGDLVLSISLEARYAPGTPARLHGHPDTWHPSDPDEFDVEDFTVDAVMFAFGVGTRIIVPSDEDGRRLAEFVGSLTEDEIERIRDQYVDGIPSGPDPDDYYDRFDD